MGFIVYRQIIDMKVGLVVPQFRINATKENLTEFIQLAEKEGFESLWVYDRMLYPIDPSTTISIFWSSRYE